MSSNSPSLPKMMLGFVVRRCARELGHEPTPEEFVAWANVCAEGERLRIFGRSISVAEAQVILRHRGRPVTARSAAPHECVAVPGDLPANVTSLATAAARLRAKRNA